MDGIYGLTQPYIDVFKLSDKDQTALLMKARRDLIKDADLIHRVADVLTTYVQPTDTINNKRSSYGIKHIVERALGGYVSNGDLIAAALLAGYRCSVTSPDTFKRNVEFAMSYKDLTALDAKGLLVSRIEQEPEPAPFDTWLRSQTARGDVVGHLARGYTMVSPALRAKGASDALGLFMTTTSLINHPYQEVRNVLMEWFTTTPDAEPLRTRMLSQTSEEHPGWGAGKGAVHTFEYGCPCGQGKIYETHDGIPGFKDIDRWLRCASCKSEWDFDPNRSATMWGLIPRS